MYRSYIRIGRESWCLPYAGFLYKTLYIAINFHLNKENYQLTLKLNYDCFFSFFRWSWSRTRHHHPVTNNNGVSAVLQYSTVRYSTLQYGTVRYATVRYGTIHYPIFNRPGVAGAVL